MNSNLQSRIKTTFILLVDFIGLIIIFFTIIFVLNYFMILPLSKTFPSIFSWLPEKQATGIKTVIVPSPLDSNIWNQADSVLINNYTEYFRTNFSTTSSSLEPSGIIKESVLIGYDNNHLQILTLQRQIILKIDDTTRFSKTSPSIIKGDVLTGPDRLVRTYNNSREFFADVPFGSFLKITYEPLSDTSWQALTVDYLSGHKY